MESNQPMTPRQKHLLRLLWFFVFLANGVVFFSVSSSKYRHDLKQESTGEMTTESEPLTAPTD